MDRFDALQIVLELARQNVIDETENPDEHKRQIEAIHEVELIANSY